MACDETGCNHIGVIADSVLSWSGVSDAVTV